ncbi:YbaB/EbfC family nucleoid-associated protein [Nocardia mangyaensis]|uniref:YbaB/EbfC family nucleoid-associated protein n=1 Tax=Nocardia mangyaensis TaxID=2213200 RepID=UPI002675B401|nr:YbaB/EbfC family nucleoid-associated protein [Nocardia mangyaensis]MDO3647289.1 YbaB/EbfC family nucleoid-associated protein [Nocardia mangyaensis]
MVETMDELIAKVQGQLYRLQDLAEATNGIRARETSPDGAVTATVDGAGALVGLEFTAAIGKLSPSDFERVLVATAQAAAHRALGERAELVTAYNQAGM